MPMLKQLKMKALILQDELNAGNEGKCLVYLLELISYKISVKRSYSAMTLTFQRTFA